MEVDFVSGNEEEDLDPRIHEWLEAMNGSAGMINQLENEFQKMNEKFEVNKRKAKASLSNLNKKFGKRNIEKAKKYHDIVRNIEKVKQKIQQNTALIDDNINKLHSLKQHIRLVEQQLFNKNNADDGSVSVSLLDQLNNANDQLLKGKGELSRLEQEQTSHNNLLNQFELICQQEEQLHCKIILKTSAYFQLKVEMERKLKSDKQNTEDLSVAIFCQQHKYKMSMMKLGEISEEVHEKRKNKRMMAIMKKMMDVRTPGEGAEQVVDGDEREEDERDGREKELVSGEAKSTLERMEDVKKGGGYTEKDEWGMKKRGGKDEVDVVKDVIVKDGEDVSLNGRKEIFMKANKEEKYFDFKASHISEGDSTPGVGSRGIEDDCQYDGDVGRYVNEDKKCGKEYRGNDDEGGHEVKGGHEVGGGDESEDSYRYSLDDSFGHSSFSTEESHAQFSRQSTFQTDNLDLDTDLDTLPSFKDQELKDTISRIFLDYTPLPHFLPLLPSSSASSPSSSFRNRRQNHNNLIQQSTSHQHSPVITPSSLSSNNFVTPSPFTTISQLTTLTLTTTSHLTTSSSLTRSYKLTTTLTSSSFLPTSTKTTTTIKSNAVGTTFNSEIKLDNVIHAGSVGRYEGTEKYNDNDNMKNINVNNVKVSRYSLTGQEYLAALSNTAYLKSGVYSVDSKKQQLHQPPILQHQPQLSLWQQLRTKIPQQVFQQLKRDSIESDVKPLPEMDSQLPSKLLLSQQNTFLKQALKQQQLKPHLSSQRIAPPSISTTLSSLATPTSTHTSFLQEPPITITHSPPSCILSFSQPLIKSSYIPPIHPLNTIPFPTTQHLTTETLTTQNLTTTTITLSPFTTTTTPSATTTPPSTTTTPPSTTTTPPSTTTTPPSTTTTPPLSTLIHPLSINHKSLSTSVTSLSNSYF